ncbi:MAG: 2-oxo-hepta-3-ene,7-dioic acid hydratase [Bacteroidota bacterium]|jgi:2-oxo-hept-3-ene-1,7-dioate hydratase
MNLTNPEIEKEAQLLYLAERNRTQISATTVRYPNMTIADAYAIQKQGIELKKQAGRTVVGYKIGLTSRVMQRSMKINEPDYGILMDDMVFEEGAEIVAANFLDPRVEVELAFMLHTPLKGEHITIFDVLRATEYVIPAVELIAARTFRVHPETKYVRNVCDTIADNAANAGIIVGGRPMKPDAVDLRWIGAMLYKNGVLEETGLAAGVLNHPAKGIAWLAQKYAAYGMGLEAGKIILAGSFTSALVAQAGDTFHIDFGNMGSFGIKFV